MANFLTARTSKSLLLANLAAAVVYFFALIFWFPRGDFWVYLAFMIGELFHLWQTFTFAYTIWRTEHLPARQDAYKPGVDVFITVAGEPLEIVEETVRAATAMDYPNFEVHILNDSYVAGQSNWEDYEHLAQRLGVNCITRRAPGGAKAGNINHALRQTAHPYIAIFDADHVPHRDFLSRTMGYFVDSWVGFVQTPQYYKNHSTNFITGGAWEQQELFFGPLMKGKNRLGAVFMCGTNMILRRDMINQVGGMCEFNIAEDFLTSLFAHQKGWKSLYVPEVLAEGLAPEDFLSYYKQQFRWARGSLEVIFKYNPLFRRGLTWPQRLQYLASASYYLSGPVVAMNAVLPLLFFYFGLVVFNISTMALAAVFLPYIFLSLYALYVSSGYSYTFRAMTFSLGSFALFTKGVWAVITGQKTQFAVTSKQQLSGNFLYLATIHILYALLVVVGIGYAIYRDGLSASVLTNASWALFYVGIFTPFIIAASPKRANQPELTGDNS